MSNSTQMLRPTFPSDDASRARTGYRTRGGTWKGFVLGLMAGVALAVGLPVLSAFVDYKLHPGDEWAGLAGLYLGGMVGAALLLVSTIAAFAIGGRHGSPLSRGLARGLLLCIGLVGLVAGVCALAM